MNHEIGQEGDPTGQLLLQFIRPETGFNR